jgi:hypothetical protein
MPTRELGHISWRTLFKVLLVLWVCQNLYELESWHLGLAWRLVKNYCFVKELALTI